MSETKQEQKSGPAQEKNNTTSSGLENEGLKLLSKAAETIAGDNKILGNILKFILSPLGLIALLCGMGYLIWKNKTHKDKIVALEKELHEAKYELKDLQKEVEGMEKTRMRKQVIDSAEEPEELQGINHFAANRLQTSYGRSSKNKHIHLD